MLGGAVCGVERYLVPHLAGSMATYCLVGMGVLFAGFLRAPITSVFMVLEVSGNYSIIVPVIVGNTLAYVVSRALRPAPIFDILTRQDGLELPSLEEQREQAILRVEDAMRRPTAPVLNATETVEQAYERVEQAFGDVFLVRLGSDGWTSLTREALAKLREEGKGQLSLGATIPRRLLPHLYPDLALEIALGYVQKTPLVPVINRADFRQLEGVISQQDVLNRYSELAERPVE
jgi:CIC family chloride channel protein